MAKKQTRRTISFNAGVYRAIMAAAKKRGLTASHFVESCVRAKVKLPKTSHVAPRVARAATKGRETTSQVAKLWREIATLKRAWKVKSRPKAKSLPPIVVEAASLPKDLDDLLQPPRRGNGAQSIPDLQAGLDVMRGVG
jgi:hypothetical protein